MRKQTTDDKLRTKYAMAIEKLTTISENNILNDAKNEYNSINKQTKEGNINYEREFTKFLQRSRSMSSEELSSYRNGSKVISERELELYRNVFKRQIDSIRDSKHFNQSTNLNPTTDKNITFVENIDGSLFHDIFEIARNHLKNGELVDLHSIKTTNDEVGYEDCKCYLSEDGTCGFAIEKNGNLISVYNIGAKGFLKTIKDYVIKQGANHLDCYNSTN